jgi:hypothetical protein
MRGVHSLVALRLERMHLHKEFEKSFGFMSLDIALFLVVP